MYDFQEFVNNTHHKRNLAEFLTVSLLANNELCFETGCIFSDFGSAFVNNSQSSLISGRVDKYAAFILIENTDGKA